MSSENTSNVSHNTAAKALIEKVRALRTEIPNFVIPTPGAETKRLASAARVTPQFVEQTAAAVENNPVLARAGSPEPDAVRDLVSYAEAYTPLADEMEALLKFLRHSIKAAQHNAGRYALTTYAITQRLAKDRGTADLKPFAAAMKRELHARKAKPQPAAPKPPATPTA